MGERGGTPEMDRESGVHIVVIAAADRAVEFHYGIDSIQAFPGKLFCSSKEP